MKPLFISACFCALLPAVLTAQERSFSPYQVIIDRMPFGAIEAEASADALDQAGPPPEFVASQEVQQMAAKLVMSTIAMMPDGRPAVGVTDASQSPAVSHILVVDDPPVGGLTLELVDFTGMVATFSKGGVPFSLKLGSGIVETMTPESLAAAEKQRLEEAEAAAKPRANSLAEQLLRMQLSVGPDVEAPPLPMISGDLASLTKPFDPERKNEAPKDEIDEIVAQGIEQMRQSEAAGETPQQYLERLQAHQKAEALRQQEEKKAALSDEKELIKHARSEEEEEQIRRRLNIELMKKGVTPLEPVDLTPEEEKEIADAGGVL